MPVPLMARLRPPHRSPQKELCAMMMGLLSLETQEKTSLTSRISGQGRILSGPTRQHQRAPSTGGSHTFCAVSFFRTTPWASGSWCGGIASGMALV